MTINEIKEMVNHPDHYAGGRFECIEVMEDIFGKRSTSDFCILNAFKYLWRCKNKYDKIEDLKKAKWYIDRAIGYYETETNCGYQE